MLHITLTFNVSDHTILMNITEMQIEASSDCGNQYCNATCAIEANCNFCSYDKLAVGQIHRAII